MARFYSKAESKFSPQYGGVDWRAVMVANLATQGQQLEFLGSIWFDSEDGLVQECTQENTDLYLNQAADDVDAVLVYDHRDDKRFSYFRDAIGSESFDTLSHQLQAVGGAAVHYTYYPVQEIAEVWVNQRQADLSRADFIPDDWSGDAA